LDVSVSGYYQWCKRQARQQAGACSRRQAENERLVAEMRRIHQASLGTYGSPRLWAELRAHGVRCSRTRVARLMRQHGIRGKCRRRRRVVTTDADHRLPVAANVLNQEFTAAAPDQRWVADMTYLPTDQGWLYLAAVLDLYSRQVVGWAMDRTMTQALVLRALRMALHTRQPAANLLHHSDRGSQYASAAYQALLHAWHVIPSMSRTGNCYDNAVMESFFATLKVELVHDQHFHTRQEAAQAIFYYIEAFYNRRRRHSALGYLSPAEFERLHHQ